MCVVVVAVSDPRPQTCWTFLSSPFSWIILLCLRNRARRIYFVIFFRDVRGRTCVLDGTLLRSLCGVRRIVFVRRVRARIVMKKSKQNGQPRRGLSPYRPLFFFYCNPRKIILDSEWKTFLTCVFSIFFFFFTTTCDHFFNNASSFNVVSTAEDSRCTDADGSSTLMGRRLKKWSI